MKKVQHDSANKVRSDDFKSNFFEIYSAVCDCYYFINDNFNCPFAYILQPTSLNIIFLYTI